MSEILTPIQQTEYFGRIFHGGGCYKCKFIQIVGYTKKRVIIRDVPLIYTHDRTTYTDGGSAVVDTQWLTDNPVPYSATQTQAGIDYRLARLNSCIDSTNKVIVLGIFDGRGFMNYYSLVTDLTQKFSWCDR